MSLSLLFKYLWHPYGTKRDGKKIVEEKETMSKSICASIDIDYVSIKLSTVNQYTHNTL